MLFSLRCAKVTFSRERHTPVAKREWKRLLECSVGSHKLICKLLNHPPTISSDPRLSIFLSFLSFTRTHLTLSPFSSLCCCRRRFSCAPCMCFSLRTHTHTQSSAGCVLLPGRIRVRSILTQLVRQRNVLKEKLQALIRPKLCLLQSTLYF